MTMDRANAHKIINASVVGIAEGKHLAEWIAADFRLQLRIDRGLIVGINFGPEILHIDQGKLFDRAFGKLGMQRQSDRVNECALALCDELRSRKRRAAWAWAAAKKIRPQAIVSAI